MTCTGNRVCELYTKQTEWGSPLNSLRTSESEMSLSTSNMWWHWCRKMWWTASVKLHFTREQDTKDLLYKRRNYSTVSWESLFSAQ